MKHQLSVLYVFVFSIVLSGPLFAAAEAELWERWAISSESSTLKVNHNPWQDFLDRYRLSDPTDGIAKIRYADVETTDAALLNDYILSLEETDVDKLNSDEQFAFWVNLYNATTVRLILNEYPIRNIRSINNPWGKKLLQIAGEDISLNDIEHRILRPRWRDARIHFVINCASIGCPDIPATALSAENAEEILESATHTYLNHPRGVSLKKGDLVISSIFDWFKEDFGGEREAILEYIFRYQDIAQLLEGESFADIRLRYEYDWSLNEP